MLYILLPQGYRLYDLHHAAEFDEPSEERIRLLCLDIGADSEGAVIAVEHRHVPSEMVDDYVHQAVVEAQLHGL